MSELVTELINKLPADCEVPAHIAIIMDGNGRWAEQHGLSRMDGHLEGRNAAWRVIGLCTKLGVEVLSLYTFSAQNWQRPTPEVEGLMELIEMALREELQAAVAGDIRFIASGRRQDLPRSLRQVLEEVEEDTAGNQGLVLNLLINYGGRAEILDATRALVQQIEAGDISPVDIDEQLFADHLYAPELPDPDLIIRPGGEMRLSNFLLWQIAYAELVVMPVLWPDFNATHLIEAIKEYNGRQRRFGGVPGGNDNV